MKFEIAKEIEAEAKISGYKFYSLSVNVFPPSPPFTPTPTPQKRQKEKRKEKRKKKKKKKKREEIA